MTWPPSSPDLNPIENLWALLKCEIYSDGRQYTFLNSIWEAVVAASVKIDREQIKKLTDSMDGRLMAVIENKGVTALLFKMEEANIASRAKAQEFIHATSQVCHAPSSSSSSQVPPSPGPTPAQFILHSALPLVGCTKTPPSHLHLGMSLGGGCYLKKLHTQERAVEEVKLAIKPYYQRKDINKDDYKDILRKAVHKICHSRKGEINPVKVSNLVKLYVQRYKYFRKHGRKMDEEDQFYPPHNPYPTH
uniref:SR-related CTD-associated factor 1 n=1 Tax=Salmo trutta TaxID=8032 RepID=A0A674BLC1_SALTR